MPLLKAYVYKNTLKFSFFEDRNIFSYGIIEMVFN